MVCHSSLSSRCKSLVIVFHQLIFGEVFFISLVYPTDTIHLFASKFLWKSKVKVFAWWVAHKVNTNDMLQLRRPYKALSPEYYILCSRSEETVYHHFLHCSMTLQPMAKAIQIKQFGLGSLFVIWWPSHIGVWRAPSKAKPCDTSLVFCWYGLCGGKEMLGFSKTRRELQRQFGI